MKQFLVICALVLLLAGSAQATAVTYDFSGAFSTGDTVTASFTYDDGVAPLAYNVHGLSRNATYALTSWDVTVDGSLGGIIPSTTFSSSLLGHTSEYCEGICMFSPTLMDSLTFWNPDGYKLNLSFTGWNTLLQGRYDSPSPNWLVALLQTGTLSGGIGTALLDNGSAVPEPPTWLLLMSGLGLVAWWRAVL